MSRNAWVLRYAKVVLGEMDVCVADAAELEVELDQLGAKVIALDAGKEKKDNI